METLSWSYLFIRNFLHNALMTKLNGCYWRQRRIGFKEGSKIVFMNLVTDKKGKSTQNEPLTIHSLRGKHKSLLWLNCQTPKFNHGYISTDGRKSFYYISDGCEIAQERDGNFEKILFVWGSTSQIVVKKYTSCTQN